MSAASVFSGLAQASPGAVVPITDKYHPGGQGDQIYQLMRVMRNGRPHLVGAPSKAALLIDWTTGEVLHDFSDVGAEPRLGTDSYCVCATWKGKYYFGGWVKAPAIVGASNNHTNKYSWVGEFDGDMNFIRYIVLDKSQASDSWQAEVSDLIPTNDALYILRGDVQAGSATGPLNTGIFKYTGDAANITQVATDLALKGIIYKDKLWASVRGQNTVRVIDVMNSDASSTFIYNAISARVGTGTKSVNTTFRTGWGILGGLAYHGTTNGFFVGDPRVDASTTIFIPAFIMPNDSSGLYRVVGWRSQFKQVAGGLVTAVNPDISGADTDSVPAYLIWIGPGGQVKVLDVGGSFGGIEVHNDRLYYGVASMFVSDLYSNYRSGSPMLASIPVEDIKTRKPPALLEHLAYSTYTVGSSGSGGVLGGYPTLGYEAGRATLTASVAGSLTPITYPATRSVVAASSQRSYAAITFTAGQTQDIDLAPYLCGDLLGFTFSAAGVISGSVMMR